MSEDAQAGMPETGRDFVFQGHVRMTYPSFQHPERPGVLVADPGEQIDFGSGSPPPDGLWYDVVSGKPYAGPPPDVVADGPGTGDEPPEQEG